MQLDTTFASSAAFFFKKAAIITAIYGQKHNTNS